MNLASGKKSDKQSNLNPKIWLQILLPGTWKYFLNVTNSKNYGEIFLKAKTISRILKNQI